MCLVLHESSYGVYAPSSDSLNHNVESEMPLHMASAYFDPGSSDV